MQSVQIHQFPAIPQAPADNDVLAIEVNGITYKVSKAVLAAAIAANISPADIGAYSKTQTYAKTETYSKTETDSLIQQSTAFLSEDGYNGQMHDNLNTLYAGMSSGTFGMSLYHNAANAPRTGDGFVISQKASDQYGGQFAITDVNIYYRKNTYGTWSDWFEVNNQIKVKTLSVNYSVSANGSYNTNLKTLIDADLPSGHKCIGISGFTTNDVNVLPISVRYEDGSYSFQVRSISSSSLTGHATVYYMYTPN